MGLAEVSGSFPINSYLLQPRTPGQPRRSSWMDGRERALVFFWEAPNGRIYLMRTQAPYVSRLIQRRFGTDPDGRIGDLTRRAIIAHAQARGYAIPNDAPTLGPVMGYALAQGIFGGGQVAFPSPMEFPDANAPRLPLAAPDGRDHTFISAFDVALGRDVPMVVAQNGAMVPSTSTQPPAPTPTPTPGTQQNLVAPQPTPPAPTPTPGTQPTPTPTPGTQQNLVAPQPTPPAPTPTPTPGTQPTPTILQNFIQQFPGGQRFMPPLSQAVLTAPDGKTFSVIVPMFPAAEGGCPKQYIDQNGTCKLAGYGLVPGGMLIPSRNGEAAINFADPKSYAAASKTAGTLLALGGAAIGGLVRVAT